jgi:hypothetical protein
MRWCTLERRQQFFSCHENSVNQREGVVLLITKHRKQRCHYFMVKAIHPIQRRRHEQRQKQKSSRRKTILDLEQVEFRERRVGCVLFAERTQLQAWYCVPRVWSSCRVCGHYCYGYVHPFQMPRMWRFGLMCALTISSEMYKKMNEYSLISDTEIIFFASFLWRLPHACFLQCFNKFISLHVLNSYL